MWIDFKLYFYVRIHKPFYQRKPLENVVNWFQIVFLREDSQAHTPLNHLENRCELISNCIFTWGFTSCCQLDTQVWLLWIDFKLYFYVRIHKQACHIKRPCLVVNWFQIVFLREDSQEGVNKTNQQVCCELISNCIFTWGFTSQRFNWKRWLSLWIDFKLYFYVRIHKFIE